MANYQWYKVGSVTIQNGSTAVNGIGTDWLIGGVKDGDIFIINDTPFEIAKVTGNQSLSLAKPYSGANVTRKEYAIIPRSGEVLQSELALLLKNLVYLIKERVVNVEAKLIELDLRTQSLKGLGLYRDTDGDLSQDENAIEPVSTEDNVATTTQVQQMVDEVFDSILLH